MTKVTLDMSSFKALASDTRLSILKALDGKKMNLKDISKATELNKATLHEHLTKLAEAGLVKRKERKGHKWVYYKLTWKGEGLLHPENTRIVVLFSATFVALAAGVIQFVNFIKNKATSFSPEFSDRGIIFKTKDMPSQPEHNWNESIGVNDTIMDNTSKIATDNTSFGINEVNNVSQEPVFLYIAIACFIIFAIFLTVAIWRYNKNKTPKF